jgi:hypothetical protein
MIKITSWLCKELLGISSIEIAEQLAPDCKEAFAAIVNGSY